ncbi:MAG: leucine-rich repeat domain-containing protein, partial [Promethearchaeota archaeon]
MRKYSRRGFRRVRKSPFSNLNSKIRDGSGDRVLNLSFHDHRELASLNWDALLKNFNYLDLSGCRLDDLSFLPASLNLKGMFLDDNRFSSFLSILSLANLEYLSLKNNDFRSLDGIDKFSRLEVLDLGFNKIAEIPRLDNLKRLRILLLNSNNIRWVKGLGSLKKLKKLNISGNPISRKLIKDLGGFNDDGFVKYIA